MTIITIPLDEPYPAHPHLRRFDVRTDLRAVADLVERCFEDTLDPDGRRYIRNMRRTADSPGFFRWAAGLGERAGVTFGGFVWEHEGAIIGNLSLIPMPSLRGRVFLIANVAVHPDHRRQGIARSLTDAALAEASRRRADRLWLHVRADNPAAVHLYRSAGFEEAARRTSWYNTGRALGTADPAGTRITGLAGRDWPLAQRWLRRLHPPDLDWYLTLDLRSLRPGPAGWFARLMTGEGRQRWAAVHGSRLQAVLSLQRTRTAADRLWLAAPEDPDPAAIRLLLRRAELEISGNRPLHLEYPAGQAVEALQSAGYTPLHTLIWMQRGG